MSIKLKVNNQQVLHLTQMTADGPTYLTTIVGDGDVGDTEAISPGDFVTMLNWYRYQKRNGNTNLLFE